MYSSNTAVHNWVTLNLNQVFQAVLALRGVMGHTQCKVLMMCVQNQDYGEVT